MNKKIIYLVSEDWYFCSHRQDIAKAAKQHGYQITVITRVRNHGEIIRNTGINLVNVEFQRSARHPLKDIKLLFSLIRLYRQIKPDLVHHVALKPILIGSVAAIIAGVPVVINALTGLGYIFTSDHLKARILRVALKLILLFLLSRNNMWTIFQNEDDRDFLCLQGLVSRDKAELIRGSGVDIRKFGLGSELPGAIVIMLASRMLRDKGVTEFVEAARICREHATKARFILVGDIDLENHASIQLAELKRWQVEGVIEWWGQCNDMPGIFQQVHIVCLPSYREGLPKVLLEAAASGKPIVATDVPGCREIVINEENGLLVPVKNAERLARAITRLAENKQLRIKMGKYGRKLVESEFSVDIINSRTLALYERALSS